MATVGTGNNFPQGQCTWWADYRYHQLTGHYISWGGDAWSWLTGAKSSGWQVSSSPPQGVPAIVILQPNVQGAGGLGHVAVVEKVNNDGSVYTSNLNWAGNQTSPTYVTFHPGPGVSFAWYPGVSSVTSSQSASMGIPVDLTSNAVSSTPDVVGMLQSGLVHVGLFLLAIVLTGFGFYMVFKDHIDPLVSKGVADAKKVAETAVLA